MTSLLTDNLPLLAGAPNGINKLRVLILELAVRGKLVPQDPSDEPASELLKRITKGKALSGNLKRTKLLAEITEDEQPFVAPSSWVFSRLGYVGEWAVGSGFPTQEQGLTDQPIPFCKVSDMNLSGNERFILTAKNSIDETTASRLRVNIHPAGTVVFPKIGGAIATNKRRLLVKPTAIDNNCLGLTPNGTLSSDYLYLLLSSIDLTRYQAGTSVPALSQGVLADIIVGVPPLAEQDRISAKVDELMALCDRLEAQQADAESAHTQLVQALLDSLTQASDATDFAANWQRLAEHFHPLFTTEPSIDALKQTLLQLAVRGKLVPQDPNDEPASELLRRITEERESCVAGRRSAKHTALPSTDDTDKTFELPSGWEWVRLQQIISVSSGDGLVSANMKAEGEIPVYGGNGVTGHHDKKNIDKATLVIGRVGYYCGSIHLTPASAWITDNALIVSFSEENLYKNFLFWLLKGTNLKERENATAQPVISGRKIYPIVLAIPPLAEQHRIVAKVDQLMALCDQLKTRLTQARQLNEQLASTLIEQAVA